MSTPPPPTEDTVMIPPPAEVNEEPITFSSKMVPGDAVVDPVSDDEAQAPRSVELSTSTAAASTNDGIIPTTHLFAEATTSSPSPSPSSTTIVPLLSVSPDGSKTRTFHAKYFLPVESDPSTSRLLDLPESYFSPTATELQNAFAGQVKKREELIDAPLMTKKLREREEAMRSRERASRWPQTRIRVRFSDRSQLEGVFPSTDKMVAIYEFVKLALREDIRQIPFLLYQTPPRREFPRGDSTLKGKSLMDLELTPSSVFYIKFLDRDDLSCQSQPLLLGPLELHTDLTHLGLRKVMKPPPLRSELLGAASDFPLPTPFNPSTKPPPLPIAGKEKSKTNKLGFGGSSGKVTPSWLKIGKSELASALAR